jgi:hypothetical protein
MMRKFSILLLVLMITSCLFGQKDVGSSIDVKQVSGNISLDGHQLFYSLPMNKILVKISITKTVLAKGPYAEFALRHLNITSGIIDADAMEYRIDSVSLERISQADSSKRYAVHFTGFENLPELQLNSDGCIIACNCPRELAGYSFSSKIVTQVEQEKEASPFYDLGTKSFLEEKEKELSQAIQNDSNHVRTPYEEEKFIPKTPDEIAENAAAFIRKIRKRRLKLIVSMYQESNAVDGNAMRIMVDELEKLEKSYVELFVGKTESISYTLSYIYSPNENTDADLQTLCWFSKSMGLVNQKSDVRRNDFKPLTIRVQTSGINPKVTLPAADVSSKNSNAARYGLFYRIPATTEVIVECPENMHVNKQMQIAQKGFVVPLPVEYFINRKYSIEFDGQTGALRRILLNP